MFLLNPTPSTNFILLSKYNILLWSSLSSAKVYESIGQSGKLFSLIIMGVHTNRVSKIIGIAYILFHTLPFLALKFVGQMHKKTMHVC